MNYAGLRPIRLDIGLISPINAPILIPQSTQTELLWFPTARFEPRSCSEYLRHQEQHVGSTQTQTVSVFMVMREHVTQYNSMAQWCVFNCF